MSLNHKEPILTHTWALYYEAGSLFLQVDHGGNLFWACQLLRSRLRSREWTETQLGDQKWETSCWCEGGVGKILMESETRGKVPVQAAQLWRKQGRTQSINFDLRYCKVKFYEVR